MNFRVDVGESLREASRSAHFVSALCFLQDASALTVSASSTISAPQRPRRTTHVSRVPHIDPPVRHGSAEAVVLGEVPNACSLAASSFTHDATHAFYVNGWARSSRLRQASTLLQVRTPSPGLAREPQELSGSSACVRLVPSTTSARSASWPPSSSCTQSCSEADHPPLASSPVVCSWLGITPTTSASGPVSFVMPAIAQVDPCEGFDTLRGPTSSDLALFLTVAADFGGLSACQLPGWWKPTAINHTLLLDIHTAHSEDEAPMHVSGAE